MNRSTRLLRTAFSLLAFGFAFASICTAQKLALTFDDLPLNGERLPPGVTQTETAKNVVAILKRHHVPPAYGFINAKKLEGNPDGAEALKLWASEEPVGNHTYSHMDLEQNSAEAYERDIEENEPALELLPAKNNWHWLRYPYLHEGDTVEKRRAVRSYLTAHGYRIAQVTLDRLYFDLAAAAGRPHTGTHPMAALEQFPGNVPADETRGAGDQSRLHLFE